MQRLFIATNGHAKKGGCQPTKGGKDRSDRMLSEPVRFNAVQV